MSANVIVAIAICLGAYLMGGIPFGLIVCRAKGIDIRQVGSGNTGAANVARSAGFRLGLLVFLLDALKGLIPTAIAGLWLLAAPARADAGQSAADSTASLRAGAASLWVAVGLCAVLGHSFSPFMRFRGGKAVATSLGVALGVYPFLTWPALVAFAAWGLVFGRWRISSLASLAAAACFPICYFLLERFAIDRPGVTSWPFGVFALAVAALVIVRHRANIGRLLRGEEATFRTANQSSSS